MTAEANYASTAYRRAARACTLRGDLRGRSTHAQERWQMRRTTLPSYLQTGCSWPRLAPGHAEQVMTPPSGSKRMAAPTPAGVAFTLKFRSRDLLRTIARPRVVVPAPTPEMNACAQLRRTTWLSTSARRHAIQFAVTEHRIRHPCSPRYIAIRTPARHIQSIPSPGIALMMSASKPARHAKSRPRST